MAKGGAIIWAMDGRRLMTLGEFNFRSNSIGFLRFFFAAAVLWSHAYGIGGFGYDPIGRVDHGLIAGLVAVGGFFVLSGFLITRSYETVRNAFRFLWHRALRIFPAFWVCLVVTAFGFAPLAFVHERGTLTGFFSSPDSPVTYLTRNALLVIYQPNIRGLLASLPTPLAFNGSLWTLAYEFCCYISVAALGLIGVIRRAPTIIAIFSLSLFCVYVVLLWFYGAHGVTIGLDVFSLLVYFAFGSTAYLLRDRIPARWWLAALCAVALVAALPTRAFPLIVIPCVSYLTLFAAMKLPLRDFDRRMDLSYGIYIYAFPVQQLLVLYGLNVLGFAPYLMATFVIVLALAAASWFAIEERSLSLKGAFSAARRSDGVPRAGQLLTTSSRTDS
jgi:peptidoglycan/LPS O-acetylase OafA/YrhL